MGVGGIYMGRLTLGIDLRCLPADGSAGGGIAHAARAITEALEGAQKYNVVRYTAHGDRRVLIDAIKQRPCDMLFVPSGAVSPGLPVPAIPWVHDLDIFDHPEWFPQSWLQRKLTTHFFLRGIRGASQVFATSEYTKQAVIRHARIPADQITVTGEGGDAVLATIPRGALAAHKGEAVARVQALGITRRFVLVLGTLEPRKNIPLICRVWPAAVKQVPDVDLVIAGQDGWKVAPIHDAIRACPSTIRIQQFTEDERRDLLLAASLVCVPSFSEGFGLVALEATQAGTPVLASRRGALPEVLGEGPWLLDPTDATKWQQEIVRILRDDSSVLPKINFSWDRAADTIVRSLGDRT
jgi:glycosyltransferase involved in cell wall biosynthesis